jgi:hypothetical protein
MLPRVIGSNRDAFLRQIEKMSPKVKTIPPFKSTTARQLTRSTEWCAKNTPTGYTRAGEAFGWNHRSGSLLHFKRAHQPIQIRQASLPCASVSGFLIVGVKPARGRRVRPHFAAWKFLAVPTIRFLPDCHLTVSAPILELMRQRNPDECPKCAKPGRRLETSSNNVVTYYRCDPCGHVWADVHSMSGAQPRDVTLDPEPNF